MQEQIRACIRIKPDDTQEMFICLDDKNILVEKVNEKYTFDHVFNQKNQNEDIFDKVGRDTIDSFIQGINSCIFAYGQTCSGKTFTMKGSQESPGLILLSMNYLFQQIETQSENEYRVKGSYLEIYNEQINDLIGGGENLEVVENKIRGMQVQELKEEEIRSEKEARALFEKGEEKRKFGQTFANQSSSRSHAIFRLALEIRKKQQHLFCFLNLIDLAGSEAVAKTKATGTRKKEGDNINKSLLALSNCIRKLSEKQNYISYRDSKLTRLLQTCLGGNSKTTVICTINQHPSSFQESINTIKFGFCAGGIKNYVSQNQINQINEIKIQEYNLLNDQQIQLKCQLQEINEQIDALILESQEQEHEFKIMIQENNNQASNNKQMIQKQKEQKEIMENQYKQILIDIEEQSQQIKIKNQQQSDLQKQFQKQTYDLEIQEQKIKKLNNLINKNTLKKAIKPVENDQNIFKMQFDLQNIKQIENQVKEKFQQESNKIINLANDIGNLKIQEIDLEEQIGILEREIEEQEFGRLI